MNYLGLNQQKVDKIGIKLNELLATYQIHFQKLRNFNWNIESTGFIGWQEKFETFFNDAHQKIDEIANRVLTLQVRPLTKLSEYLEVSAIREVPYNMEDVNMVEEVLNDFTEIIKIEREIVDEARKVGDEGTVEMIGRFLRETEKKGWMLDTYLKNHVPKEGAYSGKDPVNMMN